MKYIKVIFASCFVLILLILSMNSKFTMGLNSNEVHYTQVEKYEDRFNVYLFWEDGNTESEELLGYLSTLDAELLDKFVLYTFEVNNTENEMLKNKVTDLLQEESKSNPYLIIGNKTFDEYTLSYDERIASALEEEAANDIHYDVLDYISTEEENVAN